MVLGLVVLTNVLEWVTVVVCVLYLTVRGCSGRQDVLRFVHYIRIAWERIVAEYLYTASGCLLLATRAA